MCVFVSAVNRMLQPAKSPLVSQPSMCHNNPPICRWVNPSQLCKSQRCPENLTQGQQAKSQRSSKTVNPLTSIFVPGSTAFINRTFHKFSACLDQALTKVNAGQSFCETLAAENLYFSSAVQFVLFVLHTCRWNLSLGSSYYLMREKDVSCDDDEILSNFSCIYINHEGVWHICWAYEPTLQNWPTLHI